MSNKNDTNAFGRRTWDREEYAKQAQLRREQQQNKDLTPIEGHKSISRDSLNFHSDLNKRQIITSNVVSTRGKSFGFYCEVCNLTFKDNLKYVDHLNSKPHLIRSGETSQEQHVTLQEVKDRYEMLVKKLDEQMSEGEKYDIKKRIAKRQAFEEELKIKKQRKKALKRQQNEESQDEGDDEMKKLMGFGGFGSTKK